MGAAFEILETNKDATVGGRIEAARKARDMTQQQLSAQLGVSRGAVGQWEINATSPAIAKMEEVAKILDVTPEWLSYGVENNGMRLVHQVASNDGVHWVDEVEFGLEFGQTKELSKWAIPETYMRRDLRAAPGYTVLSMINGSDAEPDYRDGDLVFVDQSDTFASPSGVFAYWDGMGMTFARLQIAPGKDMIQVFQNRAAPVEVDMGRIQIFGRVKGRIQRA